MPAEGDRMRAELAMTIGLSAWAVVAVGWWTGLLRCGLIEFLLLLAIWVIVPSGLQMIPLLEVPLSPIIRTKWILFPAALLTTASLAVKPGIGAALLAAPWFLLCVGISLEGAMRILRFRTTSLVHFSFAAGEGYLAVGGAWLVMSRLALHPAGFDEPIVLLTAVHFHFAGFLTGLLAGLAWNERSSRESGLRTLITGAILGPGLLGLAFLAGPKFKLGAVVLIVVGQCAIAATMARIGFRRLSETQGWLLVASSGALIAGMIFALTWAVGEYPLHSFVNLVQMEQIHGVLNGIGFGLIGLSAWVLFPNMPEGLRGEGMPQ